MTSSVDGWIVSPRKSRRKSACFSSTTTSTPARASRKQSISPQGPPPTMQQRVETCSTAIRAFSAMGNAWAGFGQRGALGSDPYHALGDDIAREQEAAEGDDDNRG